MPAVSGFAPVENGLLYYEVAGSGDTIILVGGFAFDTRMWDPQFGALADRWQTVRYDLRGFGRSPPTVGPYTHTRI